MGQKVNPNIFRLGYKNNEWNSKYLEHNYDELSLYVYQDIEIKNYIHQFLKQHKLFLHSCTIQRSESGLNIFISYYTSSKSLFLINNINLIQKIFLSTLKNIYIKKKKKNHITKRLWLFYLLKKNFLPKIILKKKIMIFQKNF